MSQPSNFNVVPNSTTTVGTTLENLKAAVTGETGATTKYSAYAEWAEEAGYPQLARLWRATAAAEKIHIEMEYKLVQKEDPDWPRPSASAPAAAPADVNLIDSAQGEIYETSDMYPSFIKRAEEEDRKDALRVFTFAKKAEAYHAERYLEAYNNIDKPDDEFYYVCPVCGYIHKGKAGIEACPICGMPIDKFQEF